MNNEKEYRYLENISNLEIGDILENKKPFIELINLIQYSYRENYIKESPEMKSFFDWASSTEGLIEDSELRTQLIYAIEEFSDNEALAESRIRTDEGLRILHS